MKVILKILTAPVVLVLTLFVWLCSAILYCSAFVFGLAGTLVGILALLVLLSGNLTNALILAVIAFLVSPVGIPMAAAWLLGKMQDLRYVIQSI
ncbi:MAG: succinate dehydrogenase [Oscillospiraceae bacterium]|nr:succinate dehydrogenase [Oscillospiraceae bacterium]